MSVRASRSSFRYPAPVGDLLVVGNAIDEKRRRAIHGLHPTQRLCQRFQVGKYLDDTTVNDGDADSKSLSAR